MALGDEILGTTVLGVSNKGIILPKSLVLSSLNTSMVTQDIVIPALAKDIIVKIKRPTTEAPLSWGSADRIFVTVIVTANGVEYRYSGGCSGGIRVDPDGYEIPEYVFQCGLPVGFFGERSGLPRRLGETTTTGYTARVEIQRDSGSINTQVECVCVEAPSPIWAFTNSVAFDTATSSSEMSGDGVLSLTHTASGSDRAAIAFAGTRQSPILTSTSMTYGATSMTEEFDFAAGDAVRQMAGYSLAGPPTSAETVTSTFSGAALDHAMSVMTFTGVDQTTPTAGLTTATGTSTAPSVTVPSVGSDDMVVDYLLTRQTATSVTVGADQTVRANIDTTFIWTRGSTQLGTAGGVMSWTLGSSVQWGLAGLLLKAVAAAGGGKPWYYYANQG